MPERLQKILSAAGIASRRTAETLLAQGRVTVNGATMALGAKADPETDDIRVDGRRVRAAGRRRYLLLYKPRGYITTRSDPQQRPTVIDLLANGGVREYVFPVGRLDYDSEGLLLLTSDGELAARLTHPRHEIDREYEVRVRGIPDAHDLERLSRGISLEGRRTAPAQVLLQKTIEAESGEQAILSFVLREGRNRQVRNMCDAIGHPVVRLRRVRIGPLVDPHIRPGEFRDLTAHEVEQLRRAAADRTGGGRGGSDEEKRRPPPGKTRARTSGAAPGDRRPRKHRSPSAPGHAGTAGLRRGAGQSGSPQAPESGGSGRRQSPGLERRKRASGAARGARGPGKRRS